MKTIDQVVTALKYRISKLEEIMDFLEPKMESDESASNTYFQQYERHHELSVLLNYIEGKNEQTGCGSAKGKSSPCGSCPSACGSKS